MSKMQKVILVTGIGGVAAWASEGEVPTVHYAIDVRERASGTVAITARWSGSEAPEAWTGGGGGVAIEDVAVELDGRPLPVVREGSTWRVAAPADGMTWTWRVRPGGPGRHGAQGWADDEQASVDGRALLMPRADFDARLTFQRGADDVVATPFVEDGDELRVAGPAWAQRELLKTACWVAGDIEVVTTTIGRTTLRSAVPRSWDATRRRETHERTATLTRWFAEHASFEADGPFLSAWLDGSEPIFAGAGAQGACTRPVGVERGWELLGHRHAHPMNKYAPWAAQPDDARDAWFTEGWASWVEHRAVESLGWAALGSGRNGWYERYIRERWLDPNLDLALADDGRGNEAQREFLHYVKGPLVVDLLAEELAGDGLDLDAFVAEQIRNHRGGRYDLRAALAAWSGRDRADFFRKYVDDVGWVPPPGPPRPDDDAPVAAGAFDGEAVPARHLFTLGWSGRFDRWGDVWTFVRNGRAMRQADVRAGRALWDAEHLAVLDRLDSRVGADFAFHEAEVIRATPSGGCGGAAPPPGRWANAETPDGRTFARVLSEEVALPPDAPDVVSFATRHARAPFPQTLAVAKDTPFRLELVADHPPIGVDFEWSDGGPWTTVPVQVEPGHRRVWADVQGLAPGAWVVRARAGDRTMASRVVWVR